MTESGLTLLEPMAGVGLALSLAYLNLERFRYRERIRVFAKDSMSLFASQGMRQDGKTLGGYARIERLANLPDNDVKDPASVKKSVKLGKGLWCWIYTHLFEHHNDRDFIGLFGFFSALTIVLGVASSTFGSFSIFGSVHAQKYFFSFNLISMILPVLFVWLGGKVIVDLKEQIDDDTKDVVKPMVDSAQSVQAPKFSFPPQKVGPRPK